jgi:hypothetical protein
MYYCTVFRDYGFFLAMPETSNLSIVSADNLIICTDGIFLKDVAGYEKGGNADLHSRPDFHSAVVCVSKFSSHKEKVLSRIPAISLGLLYFTLA